MDLTHCPELSSSSFSHVLINTNSYFLGTTPLQGKTTQHVITHLSTYFAIMKTPNSIKTDNGPACISKQFKQFLHSFSIKQITDIPYNPQTQDIIKETHYTQSVQFCSVQSLSRVRLFATPWTTARQASLSITNSRSLLKLMPIESVMLSSHLTLCVTANKKLNKRKYTGTLLSSLSRTNFTRF